MIKTAVSFIGIFFSHYFLGETEIEQDKEDFLSLTKHVGAKKHQRQTKGS